MNETNKRSEPSQYMGQGSVMVDHGARGKGVETYCCNIPIDTCSTLEQTVTFFRDFFPTFLNLI